MTRKKSLSILTGLRSFGAKEKSVGLQRSTRPEHWIWRKILDEALTFRNPSIIKLIRRSLDDIENESGKISPSVIKAFKAFVLTDKDHGGALINPHTESLISAVLIFNEWKNTQSLHLFCLNIFVMRLSVPPISDQPPELSSYSNKT